MVVFFKELFYCAADKARTVVFRSCSEGSKQAHLIRLAIPGSLDKASSAQHGQQRAGLPTAR